MFLQCTAAIGLFPEIAGHNSHISLLPFQPVRVPELHNERSVQLRESRIQQHRTNDQVEINFVQSLSRKVKYFLKTKAFFLSANKT